ncbi:MAG: hypothetical protein ACRDJV_12490 [Actinomycetota bacterium]
MGENLRESDRKNLVWRAVVQHLALTVSALAFATVVIRSLAVARYNVDTPLAILQATGPVNVFMGTLSDSVGLFILVIFLIFVFAWRRQGATLPPDPWRLLLIWVGALAVYITPWPFMLLVGVASLSFLFIATIDRRSGIKNVSPLFNFAIGAALVTFVAYFTLNSSMWLPAENISFRDESHMVGFVLSDDRDFLAILKDQDRTVALIRIGKVQSRKICEPEQRLFGTRKPSIISLVGTALGDDPPGSYPKCS